MDTTAHPTNTQMTIVTVPSNSVNVSGTQTIPQSTGSGTTNPVVAVNLPTLSAMPVAMQVQGIGNMPIAVCALNSQQTNVVASQPAPQTVPGAAVQNLQSSTVGGSGGIIVLNVGGGSNNNLAAALSQIVAGTSLVQQPQVVQAVSVATTAATAQTSGNPMATQQGFVSMATGNIAGNSQTIPVAVTQVPTVAAHMQTNGIQNIPQMSYQSPVALQTNMGIGNHPHMVIHGQQPQQQTQAAPTAFMLVPIQQMPTVQATPINTVNPNNLNHLQQQQLRLPPNMTSQNPVAGNFQVQTPTTGQNLNTAASGLNPASSMQQNIIHKVGNQITNMGVTLPKNDELKAFLTKPSIISTHVTQHTASQFNTMMTTSAFAAPQICQTSPSVSHGPSHSPLTSRDAASHVAVTPDHSGAQSVSQLLGNKAPPMSSVTNTPPHYQPAVSSPGLAFLAQVSSLSASQNEEALKKSLAAHTIPSTTISTSVSSYGHALREVNNNISTLSSEEMKSQEFLSELSFTTRASTIPSAVSSTTKLGDESAHEIQECGAEQCSEVNSMESAESTAFSFPTNTTISTTTMCVKPVVREKRKKGPAPKLNGTEVCLICGDKASGFHYNVLSCEGCKGFFRRSVIKSARYMCKGNGDCLIDLYMRRKCQECRLKKCKSVGMKDESVLSEEQVKAKKMKKEQENSPILSPVRTITEDSYIPTLTPQQRNLLELLKANERRFQWPTTEDMKKVTAWVEEDDSVHSRALRFAHFTELCILIVQLVVEFTKQLPGFLTVLREDQIVLLKACAIEVMLLRAAKQYNKHDGTINFLNGKLYDKSSFYRAGMQVEFVDPIFQFCNSMAQLDLDETEYAILVAINTFSTDRPHIKDVEKVECMQDPYVELLRVYSKIRHPNDPLMFARILMKIVELRTLNNYHSEQMFALKVQDRKLPPLLAEIWDM